MTAGCAKAIHPQVWVDLDRVLRDTQRSAAQPVPMPKSPPPIKAETFVLDGRSSEEMAGSASPALEHPLRDVTEIQQQALKQLLRRLQVVYRRQADLYEQEQQRLLGDPDRAQFQKILPELRIAFAAYANNRMPLAARLAFLAGFPDPNPKGDPPPANLRPVPKQRWLAANAVRVQVTALDRQYDAKATALIANAASLAAADRISLLNRVEEYRQQMNDRAMKEAVDPLEGGEAPVTLKLSGSAPVRLPARPPITVTLPGSPAMPPLPQVGSNGTVGVSNRLMVSRQLEIWLAQSGKTLSERPGRDTPDVTQEFEDWIRQQRAGL